MNRLMSEILFNRALLFLVMAGITESRLVLIACIVVGGYNVWKSIKYWEKR